MCICVCMRAHMHVYDHVELDYRNAKRPELGDGKDRLSRIGLNITNSVVHGLQGCNTGRLPCNKMNTQVIPVTSYSETPNLVTVYTTGPKGVSKVTSPQLAIPNFDIYIHFYHTFNLIRIVEMSLRIIQRVWNVFFSIRWWFKSVYVVVFRGYGL